MTALRLIGAALLLAFVAFSLREFGWRGAPLLAVFGGLLLLGSLFDLLPSGETLLSPFYRAEEFAGIAALALKIGGVGNIAGVTADVCRELGENGVAKIVQVVGRVGIFALICPTVAEISAVAASLLAGA